MDLLDFCSGPDLGTRRAPPSWISVAGPVVERQAVKQQRRQDLAHGSFPETAPCKPVDRSERGLDVDCALRRRDEHLAHSSTRSSRSCRAESIAQQLKMKLEPIDTSLSWLSPEDEQGSIEYKYKLNNPHPIRLQQLITQMKFRLSEGAGQCFYYLGVEDDGYPKGLGAPELDASIATLHNMARSLRSQATVVRIFPGAHGRRCALVKAQRGTVEEVAYTDLRVAVAGCVDAGKSTLVAVLTHGSGGVPCLDTGRGTARVAVLRHKHEIESGRTSSLSQQLLGYDADGKVLNYAGTSVPSLSEVCSAASKVLTFIDMGGHERCLKTALYGLTALLPDYALLCCCAVRGLGRMSREHLAVAVALQIPVAVVITKVDMVDEAALAAMVQDVRSLVALAWPTHPSAAASPPTSPRPVPELLLHAATPVVFDERGAVAAAQTMSSLRDNEHQTATDSTPPFLCPILPVSSVTGRGLDQLHAFLHALQPGQQLRRCAASAPLASASAPDLTQLGSQTDQSPAGTSTTISTVTSEPDLDQQSARQPQAIHGHYIAANGGHTHTPSAPDLSQLGALPNQATFNQAQSAFGVPGSDTALQLASLTTVSTDTGLQETKPSAFDEASRVHFQVDHTYEVAGVGSVISGMAVAGLIQIGQRLLLGPTGSGGFMAVEITGIQRGHIPVRQVRAGQAATLALQQVTPALATAEPAPLVPPEPAAGATATAATPAAPASDQPAVVTAAANGVAHGGKVEGAKRLSASPALVSSVLPLVCTLEATRAPSDGSVSDDDADDEQCESASQVCDGGSPGGSSVRSSLRHDPSWTQPWGSTEGEGEGQELSEPPEGGRGRNASLTGAQAAEPVPVIMTPTANDGMLTGLSAVAVCSGSASTRVHSIRLAAEQERLKGLRNLSKEEASATQASAGGLNVKVEADVTTAALQDKQPVEGGAAMQVLQSGPAVGVTRELSLAAGIAADVAPDLLELFAMDEETTDGVEAQDEGLREAKGASMQARPSTGGDEVIAGTSVPGPGASDVSMVAAGRSKGAVGSAPTGGRFNRPEYVPNHTAERRGAPSRRPAASWCTRPPAQGGPLDPKRLDESRSALEACTIATSPGAPSFFLHASPSAHRGAVLLGAGLAPRTSWSFQAVLVLLGGHWPPRGLVSGCWPPVEDGPPATKQQEEQATGAADGVVGPGGDGTRMASGAASGTSNRDLDSSSWGGSNSCSEDVDGAVPSATATVTGEFRRSSWAAGQRAPIGRPPLAKPPTVAPPADALPESCLEEEDEEDARRPSDVSPARALRRHTSTNANDPPGAAGTGGSPRSHSSKALRPRSRPARNPHFTSVIHCANVRQLAHLVSMQELDHDALVATGVGTPAQTGSVAQAGPNGAATKATAAGGYEHGPGAGASNQPLLVTPSMRAAAALLHAPWQPEARTRAATNGRDVDESTMAVTAPASPQSPGTAEEGGVHPDLGCLVTAHFRFEHRPEWLCEGARLVVRDRSTGHVSAAGYVLKVLPGS